MTIETLKGKVAAYLQQEVSYFVRNGVDLLLSAINEARKEAEKLHDFAHNHVSFDLSVDPTDGGKLDDATIVDPETWQEDAKIKSVETFFLVAADGGMVPLYHHTSKNQAVWKKEKNRKLSLYDPKLRYAGDYSIYPSDSRLGVVLNGRTVRLSPVQEAAVDLRIEGQMWMKDYTADEDTDWMLEHGHSYLFYAAVCECNLFTSTFVASETTPGPPVKQRDNALASLVTWDSDWMMNGRQIGAAKL
jgi:hypothetical protein